MPPDTPLPGLVEFDAATMAGIAIDAARRRAGAGERGRCAAVGIANQRATTVVWDRATGHADRPGARLAGPAHGHASASSPRPSTGWRWRRTSRPPRSRGCSPTCPERADRDLCFGTVDTWLAWQLSRRRGPRHRPHERRDHRPLACRRLGVERDRGRTPSASRCRCCRALVTTSGDDRRGRRVLPGAPADRRLVRRPAGVAGRPGLRVAR